MKKMPISITICIFGPIETTNMRAAVNKFKPTMVSPDLPSPSDSALVIIKGGAQRWKTVHYPMIDTIGLYFYYIMPETFHAFVRFMWA